MNAQEMLQKVRDNIEPGVLKVIERHSTRMWNLILKQMRGGTSDTSVAKRTGALGRSVVTVTPQVSGDRIAGGISVGEVYGPIHIGPRGTSQEIRPTKAQFLAIPLDAAKTGAGVARGKPRDALWGPTFIAKSKAGNLIIFGYSGGTKASKSDTSIPLFVLKKSVVIPRRIDPDEDLLAKVKAGFITDLQKIMVGKTA